jgi:hypothetical protein
MYRKIGPALIRRIDDALFLTGGYLFAVNACLSLKLFFAVKSSSMRALGEAKLFNLAGKRIAIIPLRSLASRGIRS